MKFRIKILATSHRAPWTALHIIVEQAIAQALDAIFRSEGQGSIW